MDSKKYNNIKLFVGIAKGVVSFLLILLFVITGLSQALENQISLLTQNSYLKLLLFVALTGVAGSVIFFPVNYYLGFYLEHKYNLSNQTFYKWILENAKGLLISSLIGIPVLMAFYYILNRFGNLWWLPFSILLFILSVVLARIVPILILPLFYKITPLEDIELKERLESLSRDAGMKLKEIFRFNMSKNTRKANAAFTGLGKSKRILLGDTLLDNYSKDEIETVIAHELGHYRHKHIVKNIIFGTASSFLTFFLISQLYSNSLGWFGFTSITRISALPLLSLWAMVIGVIQTPLGSIISRKYEYQADEYAIKATGKPLAFISTLEKLTEQNLGDKNPHPFVEWFFYSHPSIKKRIAAIRNLMEANGSHPGGIGELRGSI